MHVTGRLQQAYVYYRFGLGIRGGHRAVIIIMNLTVIILPDWAS